MKHKWWHFLFTVYAGEEEMHTTLYGNQIYKHTHIRKFYCTVCKSYKKIITDKKNN